MLRRADNHIRFRERPGEVLHRHAAELLGLQQIRLT